MKMSSAFSVISIIFALISVTTACKGCLKLDEYNFKKILSRFNAVLVKFDVAYPFGKLHDEFVAVASDIVDNNDVILAEVGVKDYGEKDNAELAKKYGLNGKDDFPALRLFVNGKDEPIVFKKKGDWSADDIKQFIRDNTNIYIGLPGCIEKFDKLAIEFSSTDDKKTIYQKVENELNQLNNEDEKSIGNTYLKFMSKVLDNGINFINQEMTRLGKIIQGKVNEKKKTQLTHRINILKSFNALRTEL